MNSYKCVTILFHMYKSQNIINGECVNNINVEWSICFRTEDFFVVVVGKMIMRKEDE